jgi:hypothetical protein
MFLSSLSIAVQLVIALYDILGKRDQEEVTTVDLIFRFATRYTDLDKHMTD